MIKARRFSAELPYKSTTLLNAHATNYNASRLHYNFLDDRLCVLLFMDPTLLALLLACILIMSVSAVGVFFTSRHIESWITKHISLLISFAAGVFLVLSYNLFFEALEFATRSDVVILSAIAGFALFFIGERLFPELHCHHDDHTCHATNTKRSARKVLIGDAFHNAGDGLLLAAVFIADIRLGVIATVGVIVHELVQEVSEFIVLRHAGYTMTQAIIRNVIVSTTIVLGALIGYMVAGSEMLVGPLVGFAAGAFLYILFVDLIPHSIQQSRRQKQYILYGVVALLGVALILTVNVASHMYLEKRGLDGHGHLHSDSHEHAHEH